MVVKPILIMRRLFLLGLQVSRIEYPRWNRKRIEDTCWELLMSGYLDCSEIVAPIVPLAESGSLYALH